MNKTASRSIAKKAISFKGNSYNYMEWAGAFGDIGTLIPFALAYITILKINPVGLLLAFGITNIVAGLYYKTPVPIQPMKAIGASTVAQPGFFTPEVVFGSGLATGVIWLILGITGIIGRVAALAKKPIVQGIMMGLGFTFIINGIQSMQKDLVLSVVALVVSFVLFGNKKIPLMFLLLAMGIITSFFLHPSLFGDIQHSFGFHLPKFALSQLTWPDMVKGSLLLALPQIPLTLGNGIIALSAMNNELFPNHLVTEKKIAVSTGLMNLLVPFIGGVPMCHGAGGMAGHVRFGARTGGALVVLGSIIILVALFFSNGINKLLLLFPTSILGIILFFAGLELAMTAMPNAKNKKELYVAIVTAGFAMWNMGVAFVAGLLLYTAIEKRLTKI